MTNPPEATGGSANTESAGSAGRRLSFWIGQALAHARDTAKVPPTAVATTLGMNANKVPRMEEGDDKNKKSDDGAPTYNDIDRVVAAYAYVLGLDDPRELFIDALEMWYADGGVPDFRDDLPGAGFVRPIREVGRRQKPAPAEPEERLSAMRRQKRKGGAQ